MSHPPSYVQRFLFEDLDIRGAAVRLTDVWRSMVEGRDYAPIAAALLGQAAAVTSLIGSHRKAQSRTTLQLQGQGPVSLLVVDCTSDIRLRGMIKAPANLAQGSVQEMFGDGRLALTLESVRTGQIYQSLVPLEGATLAALFEHYLIQSEQQPTRLQLFADMNTACGWLVQKLPHADDKDSDGWNRITQLAASLTQGEALAWDVETTLRRLFPNETIRVFSPDRVAYECRYEPEKVEAMLRALGREEVAALVDDSGDVVVRNEMCNHEYRFNKEAIERLFDEGTEGSASLH